MKSQSSVNQGVDGVSTKYQSDANQVFIEGQFRVSIGISINTQLQMPSVHMIQQLQNRVPYLSRLLNKVCTSSKHTSKRSMQQADTSTN